jgi:hypothetical protein
MIDMQLLGGVLIALTMLVGLSIAISIAMMASGSGAKATGQTPPGGIRRDPPRQPPRQPPWQPQPWQAQPWQAQPETDDARELVLV